MCRKNDRSRRPFALPLETVIILALCLGGFSAHYFADNFEHFIWESAAESTGPELDHCDHQDELALCVSLQPVAARVNVPRLFSLDCLYQFLPPISPLLPPPKIATPA